jgi:hypothetical protein
MVGALSLTYWHVELSWSLRCMVGALSLTYWHVESSFWLELSCLTQVDLEDWNLVGIGNTMSFLISRVWIRYHLVNLANTIQMYWPFMATTFHVAGYSSYEWGTMIGSRVSTHLVFSCGTDWIPLCYFAFRWSVFRLCKLYRTILLFCIIWCNTIMTFVSWYCILNCVC